MGLSIGIDLGTTFSAAACIDKSGRPVVIKNSEGNPITPSVIYFPPKGEPIVGDEAKEMQALGEADIASFFKRSIGSDSFLLKFNGRDYTPTDLSAIVLRKLKTDAEVEMGQTVTHAVITVPAYFNNFQREATIKAGEMAGLEVLRIINEPTAAALAYGLDRAAGAQTMLVYDLGGGTFDVSLVQIKRSVIQVIATDGDHELGGKDWDDRIATYLGQCFSRDHDVDPLENAESFQDILTRTENAKKQLSVRDQVKVSIVHGGEKESYQLTRSQFEEMTQDLMERTQSLTGQVLSDSRLKWKDIDGVLLVGGSTRMPMVRRYVERMSCKKPLPGVNVDEAAALGAAIQAHVDSAESGDTPKMFTLKSKREIRDVMSHSLGMAAENEDRTRYINSIIIAKNTPAPCSETRPYSIMTAGNHDNKVEVYMLQGESETPLQNNILGKYVFPGIEHTSSRQAVLDIQYRYDRNGVVSVTAKQRETGKNLPLTIEPVPQDMSWLSRPPEEEQVVTVHPSILIAVDLSGSMAGNPLTKACKAAGKFVKEIDLSHASLGLIAFADKVKVTQDICQNVKKLHKGIAKWHDLMETGDVGWGNEAEPFSKALKILKNTEDPRFIILLTDGMWNDQEDAIRQAKRCHKEGIEIIAIGFGGADREFLKAAATCDENALFTDMNSLVGSFSKIARVLTESGGKLPDAGAGKSANRKKGFLGFFDRD
ncbi:MAG: Hsp70 family protein [Candidatus Aminicenantes bacterium]|nr:Hsp70 family protein [Candidatus Aminicenantes bacterium]